MSKKLTYADSGVNIDEGNKTVGFIKNLANKTYSKDVISGIGGFNGLFSIPKGYKDPILVSSTDGVGTKLKLAFMSGKHNTIGIDLVAMCVNDIICSGAKPLFFLDYFGCGKLSANTAKEVIKGITEGCKQSQCVLIGGETAELPGFYKNEEYDLAGFVVGIVDRKKIITGKNIKPGDILIGVESSGLHSNGYSLARKAIFDIGEYDFFSTHPKLKKSVGDTLLAPTIIYSNLIQKLLLKFKIKGIANITGGGLTENIPRIFPKNISCRIDLNAWKRSSVFNLIQEIGNIDDMEMLRTFNNGIGLVLVVSKVEEKNIISEIKKNKLKSFKIGEVIKGKQEVLYSGEY